jgi:hypothetical protein
VVLVSVKKKVGHCSLQLLLEFSRFFWLPKSSFNRTLLLCLITNGGFYFKIEIHILLRNRILVMKETLTKYESMYVLITVMFGRIPSCKNL